MSKHIKPQRSAHLQEDGSINNDAHETNVDEFIFPGFTIAVHAAETSNDTLWFTKIVCKGSFVVTIMFMMTTVTSSSHTEFNSLVLF